MNTNDTKNIKPDSPLTVGDDMKTTKDSTQTIDESQETKNDTQEADNITTIRAISPKTGRAYNASNLKGCNPKYNNTLTTEEAQRRGRLGAEKSAEVRRQRKTMRESILDLLAQPLTDDIIKQFGLEDMAKKEGATCQDGILYAALREAFNGDIKAAQYLRDTAGEQPTLRTENHTEIVTKEDMKTMENLKSLLTG